MVTTLRTKILGGTLTESLISLSLIGITFIIVSLSWNTLIGNYEPSRYHAIRFTMDSLISSQLDLRNTSKTRYEIHGLIFVVEGVADHEDRRIWSYHGICLDGKKEIYRAGKTCKY